MERDQLATRADQRVWDRPRPARNNPVGGFAVAVLAIFGALVVGLSVVEGSVTEAGGQIDGWIAAARAAVGL